jgi:hypothetical protein
MRSPSKAATPPEGRAEPVGSVEAPALPVAPEARRPLAILVDRLDSWISSRGRSFRWGVIAIHLVVVLLANRYALHDFPNSGDEYVQYLQSEMYVSGKLWVPAPEPHEFFRVAHALNHDRFFGKYSPGWPLLLALGTAVGAPFIINPLFSAASVLLLDRLARERVSQKTANILLIICAWNPFLVLNGASYYSHTTCLFFVAALLWAYLRFLDEPSCMLWPALAAGAAGMCLLIRPFTALVIAGVVLIHFVGSVLRRGPNAPKGSQAIPGVAVLAVFGACFLGYNLAMTGDPFLQPFLLYDPKDKPQLFMGAAAFGRAVSLNLVGRLVEMNQWLPLSTFFIVLYLVRPALRGDRLCNLGLWAMAALFAAYFFYDCDGGNRYGPRYMFEISGFLLIVAAKVVEGYPKVGPLFLAVLLSLNVFVLGHGAHHYSKDIQERRKPFELAKEMKLDKAVVFLSTGSGTMTRADLARNGITFDGPVLFVHDLGQKNRRLLERYPGRRAYYFRYDETSRSAEISEQPMAAEAIR